MEYVYYRVESGIQIIISRDLCFFFLSLLGNIEQHCKCFQQLYLLMFNRSLVTCIYADDRPQNKLGPPLRGSVSKCGHETICMNYQILFSGINKKKIFENNVF